jgi:hypothetical protein
MPLKSEEEKLHSLSSTQALFREIKELAKCSADQVAERLSTEAEKIYSDPVNISGSILRQYLGGYKSASLARRKQVAEIALKLGWGGDNCYFTLCERPYGEAIYDARLDISRYLAWIEKGVDGLIALRTEQRQIVFDLISIVTRVAKRHDEPPAMDGLVDTDYGPMWMKIDLKPLTQVGKSARSKAASCP